MAIHVHQIILRGHTSAKDAVIESEVEDLLRGATTFQELRHAAAVAMERLRASGKFESVNVTLHAGPPELPGAAIVVIEVSEPANSFAAEMRNFSKSWATSSEWTETVLFPKSEAVTGSPSSARITFRSEEWSDLLSYSADASSISLGILSSGNHSLAYTKSWSTLPQTSPLRGRLHPGHSWVSSLEYSFKIDQRVSPLRLPTGFSCLLKTRFCGLLPLPQNLRYIRQDLELNYAIPLGFCGATFSLNALAGVMSTFCVPGSRERGPIGSEIFLSSLADLAFDLPTKLLRDAGIRVHAYATTACRNILTENIFRGFSQPSHKDSYHAAGVGLIIPTSLFRLEVNYSQLFKPWGQDPEQTGLELVFNFNTP